MKKLDICIIGAGPIGLACGIEAERNHLRYLIIDKGCLVNSLYNYPQTMTFFSTSDKLEIGDVPFISHNPKPTRSEALEYYRRVTTKWKLHTKLYESVTGVQETDGLYKITTSKGEYLASNIIIATGFYDIPFILNIPGENLSKVRHYYSDPHPYFDMKVAVIGAANSAVDAALETFRKGAKEVTMIVREPEISSRVKYWVRPDIENRIKEGSIKAYFNSRVEFIEESRLRVKSPNGTIWIENDFVLAMTGYQPDFTLLRKCGVIIGNDEDMTPTYNATTMETNVRGIYMAGVICGGLKTNKWFIENSREHAVTVINDIVAKRDNYKN